MNELSENHEEPGRAVDSRCRGSNFRAMMLDLLWRSSKECVWVRTGGLSESLETLRSTRASSTFQTNANRKNRSDVLKMILPDFLLGGLTLDMCTSTLIQSLESLEQDGFLCETFLFALQCQIAAAQTTQTPAAETNCQF